jgi:hypothetical protein
VQPSTDCLLRWTFLGLGGHPKKILKQKLATDKKQYRKNSNGNKTTNTFFRASILRTVRERHFPNVAKIGRQAIQRNIKVIPLFFNVTTFLFSRSTDEYMRKIQ